MSGGAEPEPSPLNILIGLFSLASDSMGILGESVHWCAYILAVMRLAVVAGMGLMMLFM